jgi:hypothetical protein
MGGAGKQGGEKQDFLGGSHDGWDSLIIDVRAPSIMRVDSLPDRNGMRSLVPANR